MFRLNLKIALRNLWKNKGYTFINIAGLSIGMASCILIFIFIRYQLSFDNQFVNKDRIYRVVSNWHYSNSSTDASNGVPIPLTNAVRADMPQMEQVAAIQSAGGTVKVNDQDGKNRIKEDIRVFYAQPSFFSIFDFSWLAGNNQTVLNQPNTVVLSEEKAKQYFGDWRKAMGQTIRFKNKVDLRVTGVFKDMPENNSFPLKVVISYENYPRKNDNNWGHVASNSECYVLLKTGVKVDELTVIMDKFNKKYYKTQLNEEGQVSHSFQPLNDIHYNDKYGNIAGKIMEKKQVYGLSIIGVFLLLTACINFINLATAQAVNRSKEVGVRKVMGSGRGQLIIQFLSETVTITIIALVLACVFTEIALPYMNNLFGEPVSFSILAHPVIFIFLVVLVLLVSFLAGFYPAMIMSGFSPALAIKNKAAINTKGGLSLRRILVIVQFAITIILMISTMVIIRQMNYMRQKPLGFHPEAVALISLPSDSLSRLKFENLKQRMLRLPGVNNVSFCTIAPSSNDIYESDFSINGLTQKDAQVRIVYADKDYFETFALTMAAGKILPKSDTTNAYVVNETFLKKAGLPNAQAALGKQLTINGVQARISGVVNDYNDRSLHEVVSPIAISSSKGEYYSIAVKMESKRMMDTMKEIESLWNTSFPENVYDSNFINDELDKYYVTEKVMGVLFKVFSSVIIFISFIGLFGLISFVAAQRTREVAIRKVLGATNFELVRMLNGSFLLMVFLANLVAWPMAYIFISKWLSGFAYRIELSIWPFATAMLLSMGITLLTVSLRSYKAAKTNPVDALKYE